MTMSELTEVVRKLEGIPEPDLTAELVDRYQARVLGVVRATEALIEHPGER